MWGHLAAQLDERPGHQYRPPRRRHRRCSPGRACCLPTCQTIGSSKSLAPYCTSSTAGAASTSSGSQVRGGLSPPIPPAQPGARCAPRHASCDHSRRNNMEARTMEEVSFDIETQAAAAITNIGGDQMIYSAERLVARSAGGVSPRPSALPRRARTARPDGDQDRGHTARRTTSGPRNPRTTRLRSRTRGYPQ